jgi:hypothetical protein
MVKCQSSKCIHEVGNTTHMCAERRFISMMKHKAQVNGVPPSKFPHWLHMKVGSLIVIREKSDGNLGTSLPCILCRKVLDRENIQWSAHVGDQWFSSTDIDVPESKFTNKQRGYFYKLRRSEVSHT